MASGEKRRTYTRINMIITSFLPVKDYAKYGDWLQNQDEETRQLYFGVAGSHHVIKSLMERVIANPTDHFFLVAKDNNRWVGTIHIAVSGKVVEFGVIVHEDYRGTGIAGEMLDEAIVWSRNRGYTELFMHCLSYNKPIKHLCHKHGLETHNMHGDSEVEMKLSPANWITINKEICIKQRNLFRRFLQTNPFMYKEMVG
jgi:RimJ/RimL family protein N-acetyltransferase